MFRNAILFLFLTVFPVHAGSVQLPSFNFEKTISGIRVAIPVSNAVERDTPSGPIHFIAILGLADLFSKADAIIRASGIERDEHCGDKFTYNGTLFNIAGEQLRVKAHFNAGKQFCKKILGIPSSTTQRSNGSVTVDFSVDVQDNHIRLQHGPPALAISNDLVRGLLQLTGLDEKIQAMMTSALDRTLADPKAMIQLPKAVQDLDVTIDSARFDQPGGSPALVVKGKLPGAIGVLLGL